jgi:hypothetical protein
MLSLQQSTASRKIVSVFQTGYRYCVLVALTQSGKTGTSQDVIKSMLASGSGLVNKAFLITGCKDMELRDQFNKDTEQSNPEPYGAGKIKILMLTDLMKLGVGELRDAVIIWDESHLVQTKDQTIHKFMEKHNLSVNGDPEALAAKNLFILSVSATGFSEISAAMHDRQNHKQFVALEPGDGYRGVKDYMDANTIHPCFDIFKTANQGRFVATIKSFGNRWNVVRLTSKPKASALAKMCINNGIRVEHFYSDKTTMKLDDLAIAPEQPSVLIIMGRLRVGKVLFKKHIGSVWETSDKTGTDTAIQGLLGRVTGYSVSPYNEAGYNPNHFINIYMPSCVLTRPKALSNSTSIKQFINMSELERYTADIQKLMSAENRDAIIDRERGDIGLTIPTNANNIGTSKLAVHGQMINGVFKEFTTALMINIDDPNFVSTEINDHSKRVEVARRLIEAVDIISSSTHLSDEQQSEIHNLLTSFPTVLALAQHIAIRKVENGSHHNGADLGKCIDSYKTGAPFQGDYHDSGSNGKPIHATIVMKPVLNQPFAKVGQVYIVFSTLAKSSIPIEERIPKTNGKSVFTMKVTSNSGPIAVIELQSAFYTSEASLEKQLKESLKAKAFKVKNVPGKFTIPTTKVRKICKKVAELFNMKVRIAKDLSTMSFSAIKTK